MAHATGQLHHETLRRLLGVSRLLSASSDLREILGVIIDAMRDTLDADRATVFEYDRASNELFTTVAHGVSAGLATAPTVIRVPATAGLAGECAQRQSIINTPDAYADPRFNQSVDRQTGYRTRSILTVPLLDDESNLVGVAQVLNKRGGPFGSHDEEIAEALAAQAAVAMRRGRLIEDRLVKEKLERDLLLARAIQQGSFPASLPELRRFEIAAWNEPAEETGGDAYDVFIRPGRDGVESGRAVLLMADATGHGVGPAISVTQLRSMLRMALRLGASLGELVGQANDQLCSDLPAGRFITAWLGELDDADGSLTMISAGQAPLLMYRAEVDRWETQSAQTIPLGLIEGVDIPEPAQLELQPGDLFAVISDGILEAVNNRDEQFGIDRAMQAMTEGRPDSAQAIIGRLRQALDAFTQGRPRADDCTTIIIRARVDI